MTLQAILFDLDGTLIDQFKAIHRAFSRTISSMGMPPPSYEEVKRSVGGASEVTMTKLIGSERTEEAVSILRPIFEEEMLDGLIALPYVLEGLEQLCHHGLQCAVLTNKHGPHARVACDHLGLSKFLKFTIGANDTKWKKPDPNLTQIALKQIGFSPEETSYAGDSPYDYETGRNAGLPCHLVATGTHSFEELSELKAQSTHQDFKSLVDFLLSTREGKPI